MQKHINTLTNATMKDATINKAFQIAFWFIAAGAFVGVLLGHDQHLFTLAASATMALALGDDKGEDNDEKSNE